MDLSKPRPAPKPGKKSKSKKKTRRGICFECGYLWETSPEHYDFCSGDDNLTTYTIKKRADVETFLVKEALDYLMRELVAWRDGVTCVTPTGRCSNVPQWGHVIPQGANSYLVYNLSNSFRQCSNHNFEHSRDNQLYYDWYRQAWGHTAWRMLNEVKEANRINTLTLWSYLNLRQELWDLYDSRYKYSVHNREVLVEAGFFGPIIKEAWVKDGRI
jgi:hypothetical protein